MFFLPIAPNGREKIRAFVGAYERTCVRATFVQMHVVYFVYVHPGTLSFIWMDGWMDGWSDGCMDV